MIYLLHGDDISASRNFLTGLTEGFQTTVLDGKNLTIRELEENMASQTLFADKKAVVVENLLSKNAKKKDFISFLNLQRDSILLILWEDKKIIKTAYSNLQNVTVKEFSLPFIYFEFLDSFAPHQVTKLYQMYHLLLLTTDATQIFYSLLKRLRALLIIQANANSMETDKMSPWQVGKLKQQVRLWPKEKLVNFYEKLQDTEIKLKSGGLPIGLSKHLDILILSELI
jgi:DNA polymerase III delta subunit